MLSKGKQIVLGIFTVITFSVAATLALGNVASFDRLDFSQEKPVCLCLCYVLYFAVFVIYAAVAKKKNLEVLAKTTIIFGTVLAAAFLLLCVCNILDENINFNVSVLSKALEIIVILLYPAVFITYPFFGSFNTVTYVLGMTVLFAAPVVAGIIYKFTKKPVVAEEADIQDNESQLNVELDT